MNPGTSLTDAARGWPTPRAEDSESSGERVSRGGPSDTLTAASRKWPTPFGLQAGNGPDGNEFAKAVKANWPTPTVGTGPASHGQTSGDFRNRVAELWPPPWTVTGGAETAERKQELGRTDSGGGDLQAKATSLATPSARDWKSEDPAQSPDHSPPLGRQVLATEKAGPTGSSGVALNPFFVEALMGLPPSWTVPIACAAWATRSCPLKQNGHLRSCGAE